MMCGADVKEWRAPHGELRKSYEGEILSWVLVDEWECPR